MGRDPANEHIWNRLAEKDIVPQNGVYIVAFCVRCGARQGLKQGKKGTLKVWALDKLFPKWETKIVRCDPSRKEKAK